MTTPKAIRRWLKRNNPDYRLVRTAYLLKLQEDLDRLTDEVKQLAEQLITDAESVLTDERDDTS